MLISQSDRVLPNCSTCFKLGGPCSYPLVAQKPGPKPGEHHLAGEIEPSRIEIPS